MKLELDEIRDRVQRTEDAQTKYREMAKKWQEMWQLDAGFTQSWQQSVQQDGREQVTTPDPYNIVNLAMRLIPSQPKIDVPPRSNQVQDLEDSEQVERWLTAMYPRINKQQGRNLIDDLKWLVFVRGKAYVQATWVQEQLPEMIRKKSFPILVRCLDPLNVGLHRGPHYVEWAYHKYEAEKVDVRQEYPDLKKWDKPKPKREVQDESNTVTVTDFWYVAKATGKVWHAIIVDDEFAKNPTETDYPLIPIIEASGDTAPTTEKAYQSLSILHPIKGMWEYKCRLHSELGTSVLWYSFPAVVFETPMGHTLPEWEVRPGATYQVPEGTQIQIINPQPNSNLAETMINRVDASIQQATFPGVLYGDSGQMQAGYGVNILSQAATGRIQASRDALERCLMWLNELVLALVDTFSEDEGVELWGRDEGSEKLYKACLYKEQIGGWYENDVKLQPQDIQKDTQWYMFGMQLVSQGLISMQTFWDKFLTVVIPSDERQRIQTDNALKNPNVQKVLAVKDLIETHPETWQSLVAGTEMEQIANRLIELQTGIPMMPPPIPQQPPMQMGSGGPPMPIPGAPPPMMPPQQPPEPMPLQPPAALVPPLGGGIPPEMQNQMGGAEAMGLDPQMNPALFARLVGNPLPPSEEMDALANGPLR